MENSRSTKTFIELYKICFALLKIRNTREKRHYFVFLGCPRNNLSDRAESGPNTFLESLLEFDLDRIY